ncbi:hypothetical protein DFJ74DRAFT_657880 [Hyaloraphidium curvatum]|nr:hypothetical protein DFJ74DRAFT_657880 [Hyaloraphidium curvatum]
MLRTSPIPTAGLPALLTLEGAHFALGIVGCFAVPSAVAAPFLDPGPPSAASDKPDAQSSPSPAPLAPPAGDFIHVLGAFYCMATATSFGLASAPQPAQIAFGRALAVFYSVLAAKDARELLGGRPFGPARWGVAAVHAVMAGTWIYATF